MARQYQVEDIGAVAEGQFNTPDEKRNAVAAKRAEVAQSELVKTTFPARIDLGDAVVTIEQPARLDRAIRFNAVVEVDGVEIHRDEHVVVNPPVLIRDDGGDVLRGAKYYRVDPLHCLAVVARDAALLTKAQKARK